MDILAMVLVIAGVIGCISSGIWLSAPSKKVWCGDFVSHSFLSQLSSTTS